MDVHRLPPPLPGRWGAADVQLEGTNEPAAASTASPTPTTPRSSLTHPLDGFFARPDGGLGRYAVWHPRLRRSSAWRDGRATRSSRTWAWSRQAQPPHSVLLQRSIEFDVLLPPTRG